MANLFNGYILSTAKKPHSSVKDEANWSLEVPTDHDYVGILKHEYIQVDFDTEATASLALKIVQDKKLKCDILKTKRGLHFYFLSDNSIQKQEVGVYNAIGIPCDIGLGIKDRVVPLRITTNVEHSIIVNGEERITTTKETVQREWIQRYDELDVMPEYFRPISKHDYNLPKCETRNQTLFNYILVLQSHNFTREEVRKTLKVINQYVLYSPLSDKELDTITRDEAFSEEMFFDNENKRFLHDKFANYMLTNSHILLIDSQPHIYTKDGIYSNNQNDFEKEMIRKIPSLKDAQRKEVYKYICLKCEKVSTFVIPKYIGLKDSILDIATMEEFPYTPQWVINNRISYNYSKDAYHEVMDKTLDKVCCHDPQIRALLEEMIGYTLYRKNTMQVCFILTGEGSNGKSTILNCIKKLVGKHNYTSLDLQELNDSFKPAELHGKLCCLGDDISSKYLENSSVFKKCVTGESFIVQRKYQNPFEMENYATMIYCSNEVPHVADKSDGFSRRIVFVPFNAKFSKKDADYNPFIEDLLMEESAIEYLLKLGIDGLKRVLYNNSFTSSDRSDAEKKEYMESNNNVLEYLAEEPMIENNSVNDCYMAYQVWCTRAGCSPVKKLNFSKEVKRSLGLVSNPKSIDGKTCRVYCKGD